MAGTTPSKYLLSLGAFALLAACVFGSDLSRASEPAWPRLSARDDKALIDALTKRVEQLERRLRELSTAPAARRQDASGNTPVLRASDASVLYQAALEDFAHDRPVLARQALELLIVRYPESSEARAARRRLVSGTDPRGLAARAQPLQRGLVRIQPASVPAGRPSKAGKRASAKLARVPVAGFAPNKTLAALGWQADVRRTRELVGDFKLTVGDRIFFPEGGVRIGARARRILMAQAAWLKRHARARVRLEGHADDLGTRDYNRQLAKQRAQVVRTRLMQLGVARDRLRVAVYGDTKRIAICRSAACKAHNRRVVAVVESVPERGLTRHGIDRIAGSRATKALRRVGGALNAPDSR